MKLIRDIKSLKQKFKSPVLTIGIFDGVHLAHQRIIKEVVRQAKVLKGTGIVLTFNPHPFRTLKGPLATPLITSLEHRIDLFRRLNVDVCLLLNFDKNFSRMSAKDFVKQILVDTIGINYLIVGKRFHFGKNRAGTFSLLKSLSKEYGFKIREINPIKINSRIVSSSKIRLLIQRSNLKQVRRFLGREFSILGKVKRGDARGRILGYPTANLEPSQEIVPRTGVYAVFVRLDKEIFPGILNIGCRPTFRLKEKYLNTIEVHIFNFHKRIYSKTLEVFFIQRIRSENKFISRQALLARIKKDELQAKRILKSKNFFPNLHLF